MQTSLRKVRWHLNRSHSCLLRLDAHANQHSRLLNMALGGCTVTLHIQSSSCVLAPVWLRLYRSHLIPAKTQGSTVLAHCAVGDTECLTAQRRSRASSACRLTTWSHGEPGQPVGRAARRGPEPRAAEADADQPAARMQVGECCRLY